MSLIELVFVLLCAFLSSGFFTLFERKVLGYIQFREGPSKVLVLGFFQPICDALKLFSKTNFSSEVSIDFVFFASPFASLFSSLLFWFFFPLIWGSMSWYSSILFVMFCFSVSVYGLIFSGWFSRSKYALLGCVRALSQSLSYEIPLSVCLLVFMIVFSSFSLDDVCDFQESILLFVPFFLLFFIVLLILLAELNRSPFDLAEGESELVSGFSVELGSTSFMAVFLSEYLSLLWSSILISLLFLGGVSMVFGLKVLFLMFVFIWIRSSVPRIRFDHVVWVCWLVYFPLSVSFFFLCVSMMVM